MNRSTTYPALEAALRQQELLKEAQHQRWAARVRRDTPKPSARIARRAATR